MVDRLAAAISNARLPLAGSVVVDLHRYCGTTPSQDVEGRLHCLYDRILRLGIQGIEIVGTYEIGNFGRISEKCSQLRV